MRVSGSDTSQTVDECASLVYITASEECAPALLQAARRMRRSVRRADTILLLKHVCAVGLPATPIEGAQCVARRLATLLVEIDCSFQVLYGRSALLLWQRLHEQHARLVSEEEAEAGHPRIFSGMERESAFAQSSPSMPYLAFLGSYPSRHLLHLFPYDLACRYQCVPVGAERDMLTVGTSQPLAESAVAHIQQVTRRRIFQVRCEVSVIDDVLLYWQSAQEIQVVVT